MTTLPNQQAVSTFLTNYIGIDVSMDKLHISRRPPQGKPNKEGYEIIPNTVASIKSLVEQYPQAYYVFEATGVYSRRLEYTLSEQGQLFTKVNGLWIKHHSKSTGSSKKNDFLDAVAIRDYGEQGKASPSDPLSTDKAERQRLIQASSNLQKQMQNIDNQLHLLDNEAYEMPELRQSYHNIKAAIEAEQTALKVRLGTLTDEQSAQHQELLKTIPGIGDVCAKLLIESTNGFQDFTKAKQVAKFLGVVPNDEESGKTVRKFGIGNTAYPLVRAKLYVAAGSAIQWNEPCKDLYTRLRARGKSVKKARIAVAHKLIRIAFGVLKSGKPFDAQYGKTVKPVEEH
jgi:transposase